MKSDMSRRYHTRVVTNIVYSAIITCLVEVFVVANMTMIARYMEDAGKLNRLAELLLSMNAAVVLVYVVSGILLFSCDLPAFAGVLHPLHQPHLGCHSEYFRGGFEHHYRRDRGRRVLQYGRPI